MAHNTFLAYMDFNKRFKVYTNASNFQLGVIINQEGKQIAFYSRKLTGPQKGIR